MLKEIPQLSHELATKYAHRLIVISAILNTMGKLDADRQENWPCSEHGPHAFIAVTNSKSPAAKSLLWKTQLKLLKDISSLTAAITISGVKVDA
jgi:hypothetical protein